MNSVCHILCQRCTFRVKSGQPPLPSCRLCQFREAHDAPNDVDMKDTRSSSGGSDYEPLENEDMEGSISSSIATDEEEEDEEDDSDPYYVAE